MMEQDTEQLQVYSCFDELAPEVRQKLEKSVIYQRFIFERARLEKLASQSWAETGKLNSPETLKQKNVVTELGDKLLEEIKLIQFMQDEPSYEEFQRMKQK